MSVDVGLTATAIAAVGSGVAGGVFFAFSAFVMPALRRLPAAPGIGAMQSINRQAPTAAFMALFLGTAVVAAGIGIHAAVHRGEPGSVWAGVGSAAYWSAIALTGGFHVPRNDRLAEVDATSAEGPGVWETYAAEWTAGNHLRTLACVGAAVAFTVAVRAAG